MAPFAAAGPRPLPMLPSSTFNNCKSITMCYFTPALTCILFMSVSNSASVCEHARRTGGYLQSMGPMYSIQSCPPLHRGPAARPGSGGHCWAGLCIFMPAIVFDPQLLVQRSDF